MDQAYVEKESAYFGNPRRALIQFVPRTARRVLDIGCAAGGFGAMIMRERAGTEVWGVEPMPAVAEEARTRLTYVICSGIEEALEQLPASHFDCITFNDVLEHLVDPWRILRAIMPKLSEDGVVFASIPNLRYLPVMKSLVLDGEFRYVAQGVLDRTHLRFFTRKTMQRLFVDSGYDVEHAEGIDWAPFPWWLSIVDRMLLRSLDDMHFIQFAIVARRGARRIESTS